MFKREFIYAKLLRWQMKCSATYLYALQIATVDTEYVQTHIDRHALAILEQEVLLSLITKQEEYLNNSCGEK